MEFPSFGFGPASGFVTLADEMGPRVRCQIVTGAAAGRFVTTVMPGIVHHDLDTYDSAEWPKFRAIVPAGSRVLSITNPHFAAWAAANGYRVAVLDVLDWMWTDRPSLDAVELHLVQHYFGVGERAKGAGASSRDVRPVLGHDHWRPSSNARRPGQHALAVVSLGGLNMPGLQDTVCRLAHNVLRRILAALEAAGMDEVRIIMADDIAEAVLPSEPRTAPAVSVSSHLSTAEYAALLCRADHLFLAPGLGTIYECASADIVPLFLPAFSVSMLMQARDLGASGYRHVALWPWSDDCIEAIRSLHEPAAMGVLNGFIAAALDNDEACASLDGEIVTYLQRSRGATISLSDAVGAAQWLPPAAALLRGWALSRD